MATFKKRDKGKRREKRDFHKIAFAAAREDYQLFGCAEDAYDIYVYQMRSFEAPALNFYAFKAELEAA